MTLTYFWKIGWTEPITLFRHDKNKPFLSIDCPPCFYIPTQETSRALFRIKDICEPFCVFQVPFYRNIMKRNHAWRVLLWIPRYTCNICHPLMNRLLILSSFQIVYLMMAYLLAFHNDRYWLDFRQCLNLLTLKA